MLNPVLIEHYSVDDYNQWEGDWELIRGMPVAMAPSPGITHQYTSGRLFAQFDRALTNCSQCTVLYEIDVEFATNTVTRPDVIIICFNPEGDRIVRAPTLIAEVVSPSTVRRDEQTKFQLYRDEGVSYYLLLYPQLAKIKVYRLVDGDYRKVGDFHRETCLIELPHCTIELDCGQLWPRRVSDN